MIVGGAEINDQASGRDSMLSVPGDRHIPGLERSSEAIHIEGQSLQFSTAAQRIATEEFTRRQTRGYLSSNSLGPRYVGESLVRSVYEDYGPLLRDNDDAMNNISYQMVKPTSGGST